MNVGVGPRTGLEVELRFNDHVLYYSISMVK
jgi:hypothetical protein